MVYIMYTLLSSCIPCEETTFKRSVRESIVGTLAGISGRIFLCDLAVKKIIGFDWGVELRCLEDAFCTTVMNKLVFMCCRCMRNMYCMSVCGSIMVVFCSDMSDLFFWGGEIDITLVPWFQKTKT